jgi:uncharacterized protein (TIGR03663 family)
MPAKHIYLPATVIIIIIALILRLPLLSERPMHGDEAVNAIKYSQLLETGVFEYDPTEYHGPTLYYLTLPASWISGQDSLRQLSEKSLRIIPVIFGLGLILILFIIRPQFGWQIPLIAALITAISPAFVFFSRYYIHEMLFVFFCYLFLLSAYRYILSNSYKWLISCGVSLALLISTKETWSILLLSMFLASVILIMRSNERRNQLWSFLRTRSLKHIVLFSAIVFLTIISLYTSFFTYSEGLKNSLSAFSVYIERAGNNEFHIHPWHKYFQWLIFWEGESGSILGEGIVAFFSIFGIFSILSNKYGIQKNKTFLNFILLFVLITTFMYSVIPYKTPWNLLTFWFGFILLSSIGVLFIFNHLKKKMYQGIFVLFCILMSGYLGWQSYQLNYKQSSDVRNPYVYAHPGTDVFKITNKLEQLATMNKDGYQIHVEIIAENSDYWPLPWYLRKFEKLGWWDRVNFERDSAPIIISQAELIDDLIRKLYEYPPPGQRHLYLPLFDEYTELRPGKEIRGYIRKDFWDVLYLHDELQDHLNLSFPRKRESSY